MIYYSQSLKMEEYYLFLHSLRCKYGLVTVYTLERSTNLRQKKPVAKPLVCISYGEARIKIITISVR
jgi:hypothetical protein